MNRLVRSTLIVAAACALLPRGANAAGFEVYEQGAAATAMAGAFTAKADDASAVFYNPAGIAQLKGLHAYFGGTLIVTQPSARGPANLGFIDGISVGGDVKVIALPAGYLTYGLPYGLAIGMGVFTQFGLKVTWPESWPGRFIHTDVALTSVTLNPTIAWRPEKWFAIGAGVDITPASLDLSRAVNFATTEGSLRFRGNATGIGANVGILLQSPRRYGLPAASLGVAYRSHQNLDANDGALHTVVPPELSATIRDTAASTTLKLPDVLSVGVGIRPVDSLFLQGQFEWNNWSRLTTLTLHTDNPALNLSIPENWRDGYTLRFGAEYAMETVRVRAGFGYDWSPVPASTLSPIIPDGNRWLVSAGAGLDLPLKLVAEGSVMGIIVDSRQSTLPQFPVKYSNYGVLVAFSISYRQGTR